MSRADPSPTPTLRDQRRRQRQVSAYLSELRSAHAPQRWRKRVPRADAGPAAPQRPRRPRSARQARPT